MYYNTKWYRYWHKRVLFWAKNRCDITGEESEHNHTHHLYSVKEYPKKRRLISQGVVLTEEIHKLFHIYWMGGYQNPCEPSDYYEFKQAYLDDTIFSEYNFK